MNTALHIRPAEPKDIPAILTLIRELADYEKLLDAVSATPQLLQEWLFTQPRAEVLLAELAGEIIGYALFFHNFSTFLGRSGIYLEDLYITSAQRAQGYGKTLLRSLAALAVERDCGRLEWACLDWNRPSIDFYLSLKAEAMTGWTTYRLSGKTLSDFASAPQAVPLVD